MSVLDDYRLAPILDDQSLFDNASTDIFSLDLPPLQDSTATRSGFHDGAAANPVTPVRSKFDEQQGEGSKSTEAWRAKQPSKNTASIAEVLNYESPESGRHAQTTQQGWEWSPSKRRRVEDDRSRPEWIHLPEPPTAALQGHPQQPSLPPLLQGLIEPPPDAGLFPRIQHSTRPSAWPRSAGESNIFVPSEDGRLDRGALDRIYGVDNGLKLAEFRLTLPAERRKPDRSPARQTSNRAVVPTDQESYQSATSAEHSGTDGVKRKKWSEQEKQALKSGVARYGRGQWQKILSDPDLQFNNRNAVDLKDRWRVHERRRRTSDSAISGHSRPTASRPPMHFSNILRSSTPAHSSEGEETRHRKHTTNDRGLSGSTRPSVPKPSAEQRASQARHGKHFSEAEDAAIKRGVAAWGAKWAYVQAGDAVLEARSPGDVRDRFRLKWPEEYTALGLKGGGRGRRGKKGKEKQDAGTTRDRESGSMCVDPADTWKAPG